MHEGSTLLGQHPTCLCSHRIAELEQLGKEVVQHVASVIGNMVLSKGVCGVISFGLGSAP